MKKTYIFLFLIVSFLMAFAKVRTIRFYHLGTYTEIPLSQIDSITHSQYNTEGVLQKDIVSTMIWMADYKYVFPIEEVDSSVFCIYTPESKTKYDEMTGDVEDFLSSHEGATIEDILTQLGKYHQDVKTKVKDSILYIEMGRYRYICDPYGLTCNDNIEDETINEAYMEALAADIHKALYGENGSTRAQTDKFWGTDSRYSARQASQKITLRKKKVMVWNPWKSDAFRTIPSGLRSDNFMSLTALGNLASFSDYDIVLMNCHGTEDGEVMVPRYEPSDVSYPLLTNHEEGTYYMKGSTGTGIYFKRAYVLKEPFLREQISADLSQTMVWTSMCHANTDHSVLKRVLKSKGVAAFAGANNKVADFVVQQKFPVFVTDFYEHASAAGAAMKAFRKNNSGSPISAGYSYSNTEQQRIEGVYSFEYYKDISYEPLVTAMPAVDDRPVASITLPYDLANSVMGSRSMARVTATDELSAGFWLRNKATGEVTEQDFNATTTSLLNRYNYEGIITRLELQWDTESFEAGDYEYRTYLEIDGEKYYSKEKYEFTKEQEVFLETLDATDTIGDYAVLNGVFYSPGGNVQLAGFVVSATPDFSDFITVTNNSLSNYIISSYSNELYGVYPGMTYYYKAFVYVKDKYYFGDTKSFATSWGVAGKIDYLRNIADQYSIDEDGQGYVSFLLETNLSVKTNYLCDDWGVYVSDFNNTGEIRSWKLGDSSVTQIDGGGIICKIHKSWLDVMDFDKKEAKKVLKIGLYKIVNYSTGQVALLGEPKEFTIRYSQYPSVKFTDARVGQTVSLGMQNGEQRYSTEIFIDYDIKGALWAKGLRLVSLNSNTDNNTSPLQIVGDGHYTNTSFDYKYSMSASKSISFTLNLILLDGSEYPCQNKVRIYDDDSGFSIYVVDNYHVRENARARNDARSPALFILNKAVMGSYDKELSIKAQEGTDKLNDMPHVINDTGGEAWRMFENLKGADAYESFQNDYPPSGD